MKGIRKESLAPLSLLNRRLFLLFKTTEAGLIMYNYSGNVYIAYLWTVYKGPYISIMYMYMKNNPLFMIDFFLLVYLSSFWIYTLCIYTTIYTIYNQNTGDNTKRIQIKMKKKVKSWVRNFITRSVVWVSQWRSVVGLLLLLQLLWSSLLYLADPGGGAAVIA